MTPDMAPDMDAQEVGPRRSVVQMIIWLGVFAPLAFSEVRSSDAITRDPITALALFRGATPALCLALAAGLMRPRLRIRNKVEALAGAFCGLAVLSTAWSVAPLATLLKAGTLAIIYALAILLVRTWGTFMEGIGDIATAAQALVVSALVGAAVVPHRAVPGLGLDWLPNRLFGVVPEIHPVPLAAIALVALISALSGVGRWSWQRQGIGRVALGLAAAGGLWLTQTRTMIVVAPVVLIALIATYGRKRLAGTVAALSAVVAVIAWLAPPTHSMLSGLLTRGQSWMELADLGGRLPMWRMAIEAWLSSPWLGEGYYAGHRFGSYVQVLAKGGRSDLVESAFIDSSYLETMLGLGIVGTVVLIALVVTGATHALRRARRGEPGSSFAVLAVGILIIDSIMSYSLQTPSYQGHLLLALLIHCASAPPSLTREGSHHATSAC